MSGDGYSHLPGRSQSIVSAYDAHLVGNETHWLHTLKLPPIYRTLRSATRQRKALPIEHAHVRGLVCSQAPAALRLDEMQRVDAVAAFNRAQPLAAVGLARPTQQLWQSISSADFRRSNRHASIDETSGVDWVCLWVGHAGFVCVRGARRGVRTADARCQPGDRRRSAGHAAISGANRRAGCATRRRSTANSRHTSCGTEPAAATASCSSCRRAGAPAASGSSSAADTDRFFDLALRV